MNISHGHIDVGPEIAFLGSEPIFAFLTNKSLFFHAPCKISDRSINHTTILIFQFLGSEGSFSPFRPLKYILFSSVLNSWSMDLSHGHTNFGTQITLFLPYGPQKVYIFIIYIKFPIDWCGSCDHYIFEPFSAQPRDPADSKFFLG
jgi:hypothetical protein